MPASVYMHQMSVSPQPEPLIYDRGKKPPIFYIFRERSSYDLRKNLWDFLIYDARGVPQIFLRRQQKSPTPEGAELICLCLTI